MFVGVGNTALLVLVITVTMSMSFHFLSTTARGGMTTKTSQQADQELTQNRLYELAVGVLTSHVGKEHSGILKAMEDAERTYTKQEEVEQALGWCNQALDMNADDSDALADLHSLRSNLLILLDRWDEAEVDAHSALEGVRKSILERFSVAQHAFDNEPDTSPLWKVVGTTPYGQPDDINPVDEFLKLKTEEGVIMLHLATVNRKLGKTGAPTEDLLLTALHLFERVCQLRRGNAIGGDDSLLLARSNEATAKGTYVLVHQVQMRAPGAGGGGIGVQNLTTKT